ncbi:hypothetical protein KM043_017664 [Ampulex compressa]|nr:hypothetical protein KM043_017664 [Ampulex compressa]
MCESRESRPRHEERSVRQPPQRSPQENIATGRAKPCQWRKRCRRPLKESTFVFERMLKEEATALKKKMPNTSERGIPRRESPTPKASRKRDETILPMYPIPSAKERQGKVHLWALQLALAGAATSSALSSREQSHSPQKKVEVEEEGSRRNGSSRRPNVGCGGQRHKFCHKSATADSHFVSHSGTVHTNVARNPWP